MLWCLLCALAGKGRVKDADDHDKNDNDDENIKDGDDTDDDDLYNRKVLCVTKNDHFGFHGFFLFQVGFSWF